MKLMRSKLTSSEISSKSSETHKSKFLEFKRFFRNFSSESSKAAREVPNNERKGNLFAQRHIDSNKQGNPNNEPSGQIRDQKRRESSSSSDLIKDVYSKAMVDKEIFDTASKTLEQFDPEIQDLTDRSQNVYMEASSSSDL